MIKTTQKNFPTATLTCFLMFSPLIGVAASFQTPWADAVPQPQGLGHIGIYRLRQMDPVLTGSGVRFAVVCRSFTYTDNVPQNDYLPDVAHDCFETSRFDFRGHALLPAAISPHATGICSLLLGEDPDAFHSDLGSFYYQGAAPQAKANVYEFLYFLTQNVYAHKPPHADIISASWGSPFEDWWTRGIESLVGHYGLIFVASIGNGDNSFDPVLYPGAAANVIGVGLVDSVHSGDLATDLAHFSMPCPEHTSLGPSGDGRCKPDIVAPGNYLAADVNGPNSYEPLGNWSSFSAPAVAGVIGLLMQKAKDDRQLSPAASPNGGNSVMKAILLNSATKLPYWHKGRLGPDDDHIAPLDFIQGAGMVNAVGAYNQLTAGLNRPGEVPATGWDSNYLDKSQSPEHTYRITLSESVSQYITVTVTWNRHYSYEYPIESEPHNASNLRVELWAIDSTEQSHAYLLDYSDSFVDNVEHIHIAVDPNFSEYEIIVSFGDYENQQESPSQAYAIAWRVGSRQETDDLYWYDLNADGIVDDLDPAIVLNNTLVSSEAPESYLLGDVTQDGVIDVSDWGVLMDNAGRQASWLTKLETRAQ